jgi:hypothetical protein
MDFMARKRVGRCAKRALGVITFGVVTAAHVAPADACSCIQSAVHELQAGDGRIPANAGGIPWWFPGGEQISLVEEPRFRFDIERDLEPLQAMLQLEKWEGDAYQPVAARLETYGNSRYLVRPEVPWSAGERYRVSVDPSRAPQAADVTAQPADATPQVVELEIVQALEGERLEPIELDVSALRQAQLGFVDPTGPCGRGEQAAYVDIEFPVPAGAPEWPALFLEYTTLVNGAVWSPRTAVCEEIEPGGSWLSRTGNRIAATCDAEAADGRSSLVEGVFVVRMEARLPGSDVVVHSEEVEVELACTGTTSGSGVGEIVAAPVPMPQAAQAPAGCSVSPVSHQRRGFGGVTLGLGSLLLAAAVWRARRRATRSDASCLER